MSSNILILYRMDSLRVCNGGRGSSAAYNSNPRYDVGNAGAEDTSPEIS